jgi:Rps23 Pro-64 3,4-dihydroxylase Tpa1-like proline 4-hydroxylase
MKIVLLHSSSSCFAGFPMVVLYDREGCKYKRHLDAGSEGTRETEVVLRIASSWSDIDHMLLYLVP